MTSPKKSETLEIRLSHPDKQALREKAAQEGRSVSGVVRGLISDYLTQSNTRAPYTRAEALLMTLKSRPKTVFATLASLSLLGTPLLLPTTASAGDISLTLQSEYTEPAFENDSEGKRVRRMKTEIELDEGQVFSFPIATGLHYNPKASFHMSFHVSEEADQNVSIEITICELTDAPMMKKGAMFALDSINACEGEKIMAQPTIKAKYGETAEFRFEVEPPLPSAEMDETSEVEFSENNRKVFKLTASPKKL